MILAGHGIMLSGAEREVGKLAETAQHSGGADAAGAGRFPASHPLIWA